MPKDSGSAIISLDVMRYRLLWSVAVPQFLCNRPLTYISCHGIICLSQTNVLL
nr:MAG TPA: hypothetical protein [Caudoviricetes sp.]